MRRIAAVLALLMALASCALAEKRSYEQDGRVYLTIDNFESELPEEARSAFGSLLREGDEVICGTIEKQPRNGIVEERGYGVLAVRRGKSTLLMGAYLQNDGHWEVGIETDDFLAGEEKIKIEAVMGENSPYDVRRMLTCGDLELHLNVYPNGALCLEDYTITAGDGARHVVRCGGGLFGFYANGKPFFDFEPDSPLPTRLCAWTFSSLPRTPEQIEASTTACLSVLERDDVYISGVNLREEPTGKSKSWGEYSARVQILGQTPGLEVPWYNVRVGNLEGWVSGVYVRTRENSNTYLYNASQMAVCNVGCARSGARIFDRPDGAQTGVLSEGALVHVIAGNDGWLHVIVPRRELTWKTDWDGRYGFVRAQDMAVGISEADAVWKGK